MHSKSDLTTVRPPGSSAPRRSRVRALLSAASSGLGAVAGLTPHVLHHVGPLIGTGLVAGSGGTALFGTLGLIAAIPMLGKLHRRSKSLRVPMIALALYLAAFALSTFVLGPLISGGSPTPPATDVHEGHHQVVS